MSKNFLYETTPFRAHILETIKEGEKAGRMVVEGVFQAADKKNANGRIYPKSLWEKILKSEATNKAIEERRMFGELDHPQDGKWLLTRAAHIVTAMSMNENGEILGRAEILDTPNGKILQELFSAGATVGISSRGSGSVKRSGDGEVVQEDYKLETYDFVANPSTFGAFPKIVSEDELDNTEVIKENSMDSREKFQLLEDKAGAVLSLKPSEVTDGLRSVVDNVSTELVINLSKLGSEAPELKSLTEDLSSQLNDKRKELRSKVVEGMPPWLKDKDKKGDDEDKDKDDKKKDKKDKKEPKDTKEEVEEVEEGTTGSADQGFYRDVPKEAVPGPGEGWPININDAGCLNGINAGVDEFMSKAEPIPEEKDEDEDEKKEKKDKDEDVETPSRSEQLVEIALKLISVEQTEQNSFARAFAAAFLMENNKRVTEAQAYARIVEKLQEKLQEAAETGKITLSEVDTTELEEKLEAAYSAIEQLESRHRLLSAKVYAEQELRRIGQHEDKEARKTVAEAIRKAATKTSIDEVILGLAAVKGLKVTKPVDRELKEEKSEKAPDKTLEGTVNKLAEETTKSKTSFEGAELGKRLSDMINFSRSTPR